MADENEQPKELGNVVSSLDMAEYLSDPPSKNNETPPDLFADSLRSEPEIVVEGEQHSGDSLPSERRRDVVEIRGEETSRPEDQRLDQALRTIDRLTGELETRRPQERPQFDPRSIEWMDTPWGIQIPKDPRMRFVQLEDKHLESLGIDGSIAPGLNVLANAFWASIVNTIPQNTMRAMEEVQNRRNTTRERYVSFFDEYSDLKDHAELTQLIEHQARQTDPRIQSLGEAEYRQEVSRRVRSKIAAMRGISLDQYEREVGTGTTSRNNNQRRLAPAQSRARSVGGGAASRGTTPRNNDIFADTLYGG